MVLFMTRKFGYSFIYAKDVRRQVKQLHLYTWAVTACIFVLLCTICYMQTTKESSLNLNETLEEQPLITDGKKINSLLANDPRVIKYIRDEIVQAPSSLQYNLKKRSMYSQGSTQLSWKPIHNYLKNLFVDEPPGFFVEAGALDGQFLSNTLWLEKEKLWKGLLIEPDPSSYSALREKNRKSWTANACLSTLKHPVKATLTGYSYLEQGGSVVRDYRWMYKGHAHVINKEGDDTYNDSNLPLQKSFFVSHCFPLESFLLALNVSVVDFLSLDIQGGEWDVLKYFPWNIMHIRTLAVEYYEKGKPPNSLSPSFIKFMEKIGYKLAAITGDLDYIFIHGNETKLINKLVKVS